MLPSFKRIANTRSEEGFSLIELVVVIAVLAILSTFGFSYLMKFINYVKFNVAKAVLTNNYRECVAGKSPSKTSIPDVIFSMLGSEGPIQCSSTPITASILNQCCLTIDTQTGEKNFGMGWPSGLESCDSCRRVQAASNPSPEGPECDWDWQMTAYYSKQPPGAHCGTRLYAQCLPETCSYSYEYHENPGTNYTLALKLHAPDGGKCDLSLIKTPKSAKEHLIKTGQPFPDVSCTAAIIPRDQSNIEYRRYLEWKEAGGKDGTIYKNNFNSAPQTHRDGDEIVSWIE